MQAREVKAKVEISEQECKVKAVCNICGPRDVSELGAKLGDKPQTFSYLPRVIRFKEILYCQFSLHRYYLS
jgi:hypothetical protein